MHDVQDTEGDELPGDVDSVLINRNHSVPARFMLHDALDRLRALDERKSRIVELKYFGSLTSAAIAEVLDISPATVERDWTFARAWLHEVIAGPSAGCARVAP